MSDVFISYSRKDKEFAQRLHSALSSSSREVWVDWQGIPPTAEWLQEIYQAIDAADSLVFLMSAAALASETCALELEHAFKQNKRVIPLLLEDLDKAAVPEGLAKLNWILFRPRDDFSAGVEKLEYAISADLDWVKAHTRLLVRAREWADGGRDAGYLLAGSDLDSVQEWLSRAQDLEPHVTQVQAAYVAASQKGMADRQRRQLRGFYIASIIYALVQLFISYVVVFEEISEEGLMALSPVWLLGLVFGISGLTFGKVSLKRALIATGVGAFGLLIFFATLWEML